MNVSIVIPVYNEQENLDELIRRCLAACDGMDMPYEIILIDDGSRDASAGMISTAAEQNDGRIVGVLLNRNYGQHAAVMAGFAHAEGDYIVTLDADLQNPPEEIPNVVAKMKEGYDVIGTVRGGIDSQLLDVLPGTPWHETEYLRPGSLIERRRGQGGVPFPGKHAV
jgi:undecaprenyl-phosphate 4-deoxy-4-formamido-L-arabinose transferase